MSKTSRLLAVAVGMLFALAGCAENHFSGVYTGTQGALNGTYGGGPMSNYSFRMTVYQNGTTVRGDWYLAQNTTIMKAGSMEGQVSGQNLIATLTPVDGTGAIQANIMISGNTATLSSMSGGNPVIAASGTLALTQ